jgi:hypothetical protein
LRTKSIKESPPKRNGSCPEIFSHRLVNLTNLSSSDFEMGKLDLCLKICVLLSDEKMGIMGGRDKDTGLSIFDR